MERTDLRLITPPDRTSRSARAGVILLASYLCGMGLLATFLGADAARTRADPRDEARITLSEVLRGGAGDAELRARLISLRDRAARLPLEAQARAAYATVLAGMADDRAGLDAAAFHAHVAARLAPVTVPIVRAATLVLVQAGHADEAVEQVRDMFGYDPNAAARLLAVLEPHLPAGAVRRAVPEAPRAWLARAAVLRGAARDEEAAALVDEGTERWPESLELRALAAGQALAARDWTRLRELLPSDLELPDEPASAILLIYRAQLRSTAGDPPGAAADLDRAVALSGDTAWLLLLAGDGWLALEQLDRARQLWNRSLHAAPADARGQRAEALRRLARLEEREGRSGTALRLWHAMLELAPGDTEAEQRIGQLGHGP